MVMSFEHWKGEISLSIFPLDFAEDEQSFFKELEVTKGETKLLFFMVIWNICGI